jgi:hypothetical protein
MDNSSEATSTESSVKSQVQTSHFTKEVIEELKLQGYVDDGTSAFKIAISVSLAIGENLIVPDKLSDRNGLTLGVTQFDPNGLVASLIKNVYFANLEISQKKVYEASELLCEAGMLYIDSKLRSGYSFPEIISTVNQ